MSERSSATTQCAAASCWLGIKSTQSSTGGLLAFLISAGLSSWRWLLLTDIVLCISWSRWDCRRNKSSINNNCQSSQRGASTSIQRATNALLFLKCCMTYPFCRTSLSADLSLVNLNFSVMAVPPPQSDFDEMGMWLRNQLFSQIAPLKQHFRLCRICSFKAQIHDLFLKSEAKLSLIAFTTTAQHELWRQCDRWRCDGSLMWQGN